MCILPKLSAQDLAEMSQKKKKKIKKLRSKKVRMVVPKQLLLENSI